MAEETFRLPKSSYDELVKIIQAYGNSSQAATLDEVAQTSAMDKTIISRNNAFLVSIGIIEGGKAKGITEKGRSLAQALHYNVLVDVATHWRELVNANEFLQKMVNAVRIRGGMEDSALKSHIAYSAGEQKNTFVMAGAGAVVEILKVSGLVKEQDGKLVAEPPKTGVSFIKIAGDTKEPEKPGPSPVAGVSAELVPQTSNLGVSIQIQIQCTAAEIPELAPKLRAMLKELSKKEDAKAEGQD
jgi:hypothetical protein